MAGGDALMPIKRMAHDRASRLQMWRKDAGWSHAGGSIARPTASNKMAAIVVACPMRRIRAFWLFCGFWTAQRPSGAKRAAKTQHNMTQQCHAGRGSGLICRKPIVSDARQSGAVAPAKPGLRWLCPQIHRWLQTAWKYPIQMSKPGLQLCHLAAKQFCPAPRHHPASRAHGAPFREASVAL